MKYSMYLANSIFRPMMKSKATMILLTLLCLLSVTNASRILGIFPMAAKSHFSCNEAIMKSLHAAGHEITIISPFPSETKIENLTYIDSRFDTFIYIGQSTLDELDNLSLGYMMNTITAIEIQYCHDVMKLKEIQEALNLTEKQYDVMFVELMMAYECYLPIAERLGIPVIGTVTLRSWKVADHAIGVPNNPAVIPAEFTNSKPKMSLLERVENLWSNIVIDYHYVTGTQKAIEKFYVQYFSEDIRYKKDISFVFFNNHATLLPRPLIPNAVEIGGVHLKPAKPLSEDLQKFIDEAPRGVILFTFGSIVKASSLPVEQKQAFLTAFSSIPQRVIWKYEEPIENLPENIMLSSWLPQRDILEHKNVIAFMSHCGQSGVYEAIVTGTPVVTIPLFADQQSNAALLHERGVGVHIDLKTVTEAVVLSALNTIVNDTSYYQRMQKLSRLFKDRPMTPQELIVYWTEYVIRNDGASYLKALGTDMPLYEYLMLDVLSIVLIVFSVVIFTFYKVIRKIYNCRTKTLKYEICTKKEK